MKQNKHDAIICIQCPKNIQWEGWYCCLAVKRQGRY